MLFLVWRISEVVICHLWCNAVILCSHLLINSVGGTNGCIWAEPILSLFRFKCFSVSRARPTSVSGAKTCSHLKVSFQHGELTNRIMFSLFHSLSSQSNRSFTCVSEDRKHLPVSPRCPPVCCHSHICSICPPQM